MELNTFELDNILRDITEKRPLMQLQLAKQKVPDEYGLYAIFISSTDALPQVFNNELRVRSTKLLYVGRAKKQTLKVRLIEQDLSGKGNSTFFRGIGAVLGYRPKRGSLYGKINQNNYVFTEDDKLKTVNWIDTFIQVRWCKTEPSVIDVCEKYLIQNLYPLLNEKNNPRKFEPLKILRKECREIATSAI